MFKFRITLTPLIPSTRAIFWLVLLVLTGFLLDGILKAYIARTIPITSQVKSYQQALANFKDMYQALPGDMAKAGKTITGCNRDCDPYAPTAGDGIIGMLDLNKSWKSQFDGVTHVPAISAADESVLFWTHLLQANLIGGLVDGGLGGSRAFAAGVTHPEAKFGGAFVVAHMDGSPLPLSLSPKSTGIKGIVILQVSDAVLKNESELNEEGKQALTPSRAAQLDRKQDDGRPNSGFVQAYGAPSCFAEEGLMYNETNDSKDCGLVFKIGD